MNQTYIKAIEQHCPNAKLVLDRFHIVKALNESIDEVRKQQWREASTDQRKALKGLRWLLFKHSSRRTPEDSELLHSLQKGNRRIHRAWVLKDELETFWQFQSVPAAQSFLKRWTTTALKTRLQSLRKFVTTLRNHMTHILTFIEKPLTNAVPEGLNRIIKLTKNRASGFRNLHCFTDMIFLVVGDVDIPAKIS